MREVWPFSDPGLRRLVLAVALVLAWVVPAAGAVQSFLNHHELGALALDSHAYWVALRSEDPYWAPPLYVDAYLYSPLFTQVISPLGGLPWPVFAVVWAGIESACFWWLTRTVAWRWRVPLLLLAVPAVIYGNVIGLLGVMVVLGFRRPGVWVFAFATKATIGLVGVVWFLARGDWRALRELLVVGLVVVGVSVAIDPHGWVAWVEFLLDNSDSGTRHETLWPRLVLTAAVVAYAARRNWRWVVPVALLGASAHLSGHLKDLAQCHGAARLRPQSSSSERTRGATSVP